MITYVNTVLVGQKAGLATVANGKITGDAGQFVVVDAETGNAATATSKRIKIGLVTKDKVNMVTKDGLTKVAKIKWSNVIDREAVKSYVYTAATKSTEDTVTVNFAASTAANAITELAKGNKRVVLRLTFKDLPTRFRKWTESYDYVTKKGDTATTIAEALADSVNKQWKRARVEAEANAGVLTLTALPYDDDDSAESLSWAAKVRFVAHVYYTDLDAEGFESKNKYQLGATIEKTPGKWYQGAGKLVRDREAQAMGYEGILNHGEGTWPIIQPAVTADITKDYDIITLEFENMYRTADDLMRRTKQTVELYGYEISPATEGENATAAVNSITAVKTLLSSWMGSATDADEIRVNIA